MSIFVNIGTVLVGIIVIIIVFRLMIEKKMSESQSVLWIAIGLIAIVLGVFPSVIPMIAAKLGIWYPPAVLLLVVSIGLLLIVFRNSIVASIHSDELHELAIQIALLKDENKELKMQLSEIKTEEVDCH
ncbi:DUF2304 domain-containing protein [Eubacteriaceae bacterium ES3]|nr:DUF2304 domain-containing protein [Eubacteriaceae bacterium ES3]